MPLNPPLQKGPEQAPLEENMSVAADFFGILCTVSNRYHSERFEEKNRDGRQASLITKLQRWQRLKGARCENANTCFVSSLFAGHFRCCGLHDFQHAQLKSNHAAGSECSGRFTVGIDGTRYDTHHVLDSPFPPFSPCEGFVTRSVKESNV